MAAGNVRFAVFMLVTLVVFVGILLLVTRRRAPQPSLILIAVLRRLA